jgi:hypothetical protein
MPCFELQMTSGTFHPAFNLCIIRICARHNYLNRLWLNCAWWIWSCALSPVKVVVWKVARFVFTLILCFNQPIPETPGIVYPCFPW